MENLFKIIESYDDINKMNIAFALGKANEDVGEIDKSFEYYKTANKIKSGNLSAKVPQISSKDEMSLLIKTFNQMTERLKDQRSELQKRERNAAWSDIAQRIAHEIKNPLTPIQLSAEYLKSKSKNKEDKSYANTIIKKVSSIESMVDEFSKFAKLPKPELKKTRLNILCSDLIFFHQP